MRLEGNRQGSLQMDCRACCVFYYGCSIHLGGESVLMCFVVPHRASLLSYSGPVALHLADEGTDYSCRA